jgi:hypothetical protein
VVRACACVCVCVCVCVCACGRFSFFDTWIDTWGTHSTGCLDLRVKLAGKQLLLDGGWHDPPHYLRRGLERQAGEAGPKGGEHDG